MNYEEERKKYLAFCGSYCRQCDWHTGKIRKTAKAALDMVNEHDGFKRLFEGRVNAHNLAKGLQILAESGICSGCKAEIEKKNDRCEIRQCCFKKGFQLCNECAEFPCETLKTNPGVIKFHCLENLIEIKEIGLKMWIDKQWSEYTK
jgi:hypothetical protein